MDWQLPHILMPRAMRLDAGLRFSLRYYRMAPPRNKHPGSRSLSPEQASRFYTPASLSKRVCHNSEKTLGNTGKGSTISRFGGFIRAPAGLIYPPSETQEGMREASWGRCLPFRAGRHDAPPIKLSEKDATCSLSASSSIWMEGCLTMETCQLGNEVGFWAPCTLLRPLEDNPGVGASSTFSLKARQWPDTPRSGVLSSSYASQSNYFITLPPGIELQVPVTESEHSPGLASTCTFLKRSSPLLRPSKTIRDQHLLRYLSGSIRFQVQGRYMID
ncbi:hypothetical protein QBC46DRAFT_722 [Diplogelasinospora grovesii]|uniref:Uncharacterized protein n=1 Tax=Diplogelasinospora grovesii TaxID=303347 RepID=A0AAN6NJ82_9PEZI|nr:hypothetical protein QBC46DRAFT_722 [Diplogelasinospora grovesii]